MKQTILVWLVTLVKFRYKNCSQCGAFPQLLQSYIVTYRKKLQKVVLVEEEFLYK